MGINFEDLHDVTLKINKKPKSVYARTQFRNKEQCAKIVVHGVDLCKMMPMATNTAIIIINIIVIHCRLVKMNAMKL